jgi:hypothetical protein
MRALTGAIITAGALIGLGLCALGIGTRYAYFAERTGEDRTLDFLRFRQLDTPLMICLLFLIFVAVVGLVIAFIGLSFHHHRRHHEFLHHHAQHAAGAVPPRATV